MKKFSIITLIFIVLGAVLFAVPTMAQQTTSPSPTNMEASEPFNYIENGSFEMGDGGQWGAIPGWDMSLPIGTMDIYIGNYYYDDKESFPSDTYIALRKEANPDGDAVYVTQTITELPVGVYEFSAWMWAPNNVEFISIELSSSSDYEELFCYHGMKGYDSTEIAVKDGTLTITITADNVHKDAAMDALVDDLKLIQIKGEEAFATPTPSPTPSPTAESTKAPSAAVTAHAKPSGSSKNNGNLLLIFLSVAAVAFVAVVILAVILVRKKK